MKIEISAHARLGIFLLVFLFVLWIAGLAVEPSNVPARQSAIPLVVSSKEIVRGDTTRKQVIFTFDGGDGITSADGILAALVRHHVKGTFFLTGKFLASHPEIVKSIIASGHEIFNHTLDHPHLTELSDTEIVDELGSMENALQMMVGSSSKPYFRPPYGDRDERVLVAAAKAGYRGVYWTVDALDWEEPNGQMASDVEGRILSNLAPGNIYLMHLGDSITGQILDDVFTKIEAQGYHIVSLTQGI